MKPRPVWLSLGSNIAPRHNMVRMIDALCPLGSDLVVGRIVELEPVGRGGPRFLNTVVRIDARLDPLKPALEAIEIALGRPRWRPDARALDRTADIDVLFVDAPPSALPDEPWVAPMLRELLAAEGHRIDVPALPEGVALDWRGCPIGDRPRRLVAGAAGPASPIL